MDKTTFCIPNAFIELCISSFADNQFDILQEECAELIKACSKLKRHGIGIENLKEEMAHVLISSAVVANIFHITESDIISEVQKKALKYGFEKSML